MSFGSSSPGGSPEGIGGNEAGIGSNAGNGGGGAGINGMGGNQNVAAIVNAIVNGTNKFQQAGQIQSDAAIEGAGVHSDAIQEAINRMMGFGGFDQYMGAGSQGLAGLQEGSTIGGLDARLNEIMGGDAFSGLVDERMLNLQGALGTAGLSRSGVNLEESAKIPLETAMMLEGMLTGRQSGMAGMGLNATGSQLGIEGMIAQMLGLQGGIEAGGITSAAEAEAGGILGKEAFNLQRDQAQDSNRNQLIGLGISALSAFSDPKLKTNIEKIGKVGPLDLITWDWVPEVKGTIVEKCRTFGFLSTQVRDNFPDCVSEYCGFDVVDYGKLNGELCL